MVNVDVCGGVDERSRRACEKSVVALAGEVEGDLLHVGCPVDFGVWEGVGLVVSSIMGGYCSFFFFFERKLFLLGTCVVSGREWVSDIMYVMYVANVLA